MCCAKKVENFYLQLLTDIFGFYRTGRVACVIYIAEPIRAVGEFYYMVCSFLIGPRQLLIEQEQI